MLRSPWSPGLLSLPRIGLALSCPRTFAHTAPPLPGTLFVQLFLSWLLLLFWVFSENVASSERPPLKCLPPCSSYHPVYFLKRTCHGPGVIPSSHLFAGSLPAWQPVRGPGLSWSFLRPGGQHGWHQRSALRVIHSFNRC